ncbi:MAG: efflux RND transporter periplasmic adaptor subunit [Steroidobacteraceae bacterium]
MSRRLIACVVCLVMGSTGALVQAQTDDASAAPPSVLVTLTQLKEGSLPHVVIGYGTVAPASAGRKTIMAPVSAVVGDIYVRLGEQVAKGAPLIRLVPSPNTAASYIQGESALAVTRQLVARTRKLVSLHLATQQQLAEAERSESDARSALAALEALGAGGPHLFRAPFPAIVTSLTTSPGTIVSEGTALLDLAAPRQLVLTVGIVPAQANEINAEDAASVTLVGATRAFAGRVILRGAVAKSDTGLVPVEVPLPAGAFLPGEMAEAVISTARMHGYVVPHEAILADDSGAPYVVQAVNNEARKVPVRILDAYGDRNVISGPLDAHAPLVLAGNYQLDNGTRVRLADPVRAQGGK